MKEELVGNKGFSTIELVLALAILSVTLSGAVLASYNISYWNESGQAEREAFSALKKSFSALEAQAARDFYSITTASTTAVSDISLCAKYATVSISWQVPHYPVATATLASFLANETEAHKEGEDCMARPPGGAWAAPAVVATVDFGGNPTALDVFNGLAYIGTDQSPYFLVASKAGVLSFQNRSAGQTSANAIEVAKQSGRTYAFLALATSSKPFQVLDVTDATNPVLLSSRNLTGVTATSSQANGWRIFYYDKTIYFVTRFISGFSPELHIFGVSDPANPVELGSYKLGTSAYALQARDQKVAGVLHRFLYLATTADAKELTVLEVTDPAHVSLREACALPGMQQGLALAALGNTLYFGRDTVPNGSELYAFDVTNPLGQTACPPLLKDTDVTTDSFSRHVQALRASGPYVFVATNNTTNAHGQIQIRNSDPATNFALIGTYVVPRLIENAIDVDGDFLYVLASTTPRLTVLSGTP